ncbi:MAG: hypothetical protein H7321_05475 [Bacteroidia bacterium]|nr:hypothetical protein [Bacteroidia bacterium]
MKHLFKTIVILSFLMQSCLKLYSQDTAYIKVHFLYGSKPLKKYKKSESKWFGGKLGGHVGVENGNGQIIDFIPSGKFHIFPKKDRHSTFTTHSIETFYSIFGSDADSVKRAIVYIPVTAYQKKHFDSIAQLYLNQSPYDYALFGMRCGAAGYDLLSKINILPEYTVSKTSRKIFYPRRLRKKVFKLADEKGWKTENRKGGIMRKWEKDR